MILILDLLRWKKLKRFKGEETPLHDDRGYTHEEIQTLLNVSDLRLKTSVLLMCSAGLRVGALPILRLKHLERKGNLYKINVYASLRENYFTFCTPESAAMIDTYLQFRERYGEKLNPESPLFRKDFDIDIQEDVRKNVFALSYFACMKDIEKHLQIAGLRTVDHLNKNNRKEVKLTHGFRKFCTKQLLESDLKTEKRWLLEGHDLPRNDPHYVRVSEDELLTEYEKAINLLTIDPANRLRKKVEKLEVEKSQVDRLALQIEEIKKALKKK